VLAVDELPPILVVEDGDKLYLCDGFHRLRAHRLAGRTTIQARVERGTKRDAVFHAISANTRHGVRVTDSDKRRAVERMLRDPEWASWSNRQIAKHAGASEGLVRKMRQELANDVPIPESTRGADGKTYRTQVRICAPDEPVRPETTGVVIAGRPFDFSTRQSVGGIPVHPICELLEPDEEDERVLREIKQTEDCRLGEYRDKRELDELTPEEQAELERLEKQIDDGLPSVDAYAREYAAKRDELGTAKFMEWFRDQPEYPVVRLIIQALRDRFMPLLRGLMIKD
jgi:hypothetical protein